MEAAALHTPVTPGPVAPPDPAGGGAAGNRDGEGSRARQPPTDGTGERGSSAERVLKQAPASTDKPSEEPAGRRSRLAESVAEANGALRHLDVHLELSVDEASDEVVARVINDQTGEVVREIPREEVREMARNLQETGGGALLDTRG